MKLKTVITSTLVLLFLLSACRNTELTKEPYDKNTDSPAPADQVNPAPLLYPKDFFPIQKDVSMLYEGHGNEFAEFKTQVDYVKDHIVQIKHINPGTESISVYQVTNDGVKRVFFLGETYYNWDYTKERNRNEIILPSTIKDGTTWTLPSGATKTITSLSKEVEVPFGSFSALEITTKDEYSTTKEYYAKDIGLIQTIFIPNEDPKNTISSLLSQVLRGEPSKKSITVFFPDFNRDRLVYVNREVQWKTNTDIAPILEQELKKVPQNSNLTPSMPANAKILGLEKDTSKGRVIVDFSKEFISEMNAGAALETMLLQSVANTVGTYFQSNLVGITIEGAPYHSGHIFLKAEDGLPVDTENIEEYKLP
jgi:hypothetical protein